MVCLGLRAGETRVAHDIMLSHGHSGPGGEYACIDRDGRRCMESTGATAADL